MKTLIVAATAAEIAPSIPLLDAKDVDFLITGVGMVATAFKMGQFLSGKSYDLLLNVGIAGTFDSQHPLGSVFRVKSDRIFRLGAENGNAFLPIEELGFGGSIFYEQLPRSPVTKSIQELARIDGITVNTVHGGVPSISSVTQTYGTQLLESMEGAAFFYVAQHLAIPCVQIRSISNLIEHRNPDNWDIKLAITRLNEWLQDYLKSSL